jgi:hypothetical protein
MSEAPPSVLIANYIKAPIQRSQRVSDLHAGRLHEQNGVIGFIGLALIHAPSEVKASPGVTAHRFLISVM